MDKCLKCDTPIYDGGTWGYCSQGCLDTDSEEKKAESDQRYIKRRYHELMDLVTESITADKK